MQRLILIAGLAAACGPSTPHQNTTPAASSDDKDVVCTDMEYGPRGSTTERCRRRTDVDSDKRFQKDLIDQQTHSNH
jgi:hypothetical protein